MRMWPRPLAQSRLIARLVVVFPALLFIILLPFVEPWTVVPTNVTATPLSMTTALISWTIATNDETNTSSHETSSILHRLEITYKPLQERQRMIVPVPVEMTSYVLHDLRPGGVYTVSVSSYSRGHGRIRSPPTRLIMLPSTIPSTSPPPLLLIPPSSHHRRPNVYTSTQSEGDLYYNSNAGGVVFVRGEEVGIVVLVLIVWVGAVALFFHRWGKIRMLLPYQPVFKEEEPAIAMGCSPSPTIHGQQLQHQSSLTQSVGSPAVLVSANKFVSLDPAAMRRNQFMLHSRLARMQAYTERRNWPASMNRIDSGCIIVGRTSPRRINRQQAYAGRRANTIASACDGDHNPIRRSSRRFHPTGSEESTGSGDTRNPSEQQSQHPRKAHSAEVITLTVTECDTESPSSSTHSTPGAGDSLPMTDYHHQRSTSAMEFILPCRTPATAECAL